MRLIDADDKENITIVFDNEGRGIIKRIDAPTVQAVPISVINDIKADISLLRDATINVNEDTAYGLWIALDLINKHINNNGFIGRNEI